MTVQITIRGVPEEVRDKIAARAASRRQSMQEFLRGELERLVSKPSVETGLKRSASVRRPRGLESQPPAFSEPATQTGLDSGRRRLRSCCGPRRLRGRRFVGRNGHRRRRAGRSGIGVGRNRQHPSSTGAVRPPLTRRGSPRLPQSAPARCGTFSVHAVCRAGVGVGRELDQL